MLYLSEHPGELHVLGGRVAALQQPGSAVHVHQTLVVVVVDRRAQHSQVELLGAGVVDVLLGDRNGGLSSELLFYLKSNLDTNEFQRHQTTYRRVHILYVSAQSTLILSGIFNL